MSLRTILPAVGAGALLFAVPSARATGQKLEKHFSVTGRPVVCIHNIGNGRIEVKSSKNSEVAVFATQASAKVNLDIEQAGDRIDINSIVMEPSASPEETQVNFQLAVPEET